MPTGIRAGAVAGQVLRVARQCVYTRAHERGQLVAGELFDGSMEWTERVHSDGVVDVWYNVAAAGDPTQETQVAEGLC